jgi:molecular chaperone Hsp33
MIGPNRILQNTPKIIMTDSLKTLIFEQASARAQMVKLTDTWQTVSNNNPCPPAVQNILGQLLVASAMLSASLKFEGSLILQIQGDGPVRLIVAECNSRLGLRATVKIKDNAEISNTASFQELVNSQGKGMFVLVLDPRNRQPGQAAYQGIVPLTGDSVSDALEAYMHSSEQLETRLVLHADTQQAAGLMIQQMPSHGGNAQEHNFDPDGWNRLQAIANTLHAQEHLETPVEELAKRLFWEEQASQLADRQPKFECSCSREKVENMLINLGPQEVNTALQENPIIEVACDFCSNTYTFNKHDCTQLFQNQTQGNKSDNTLH